MHCVRGQFHGAHALLCLASTRNSRLPLRKRLFNALLPIDTPAKLTNPVWECFRSKQHYMITSVCVWLTVTPALQQTYNFKNCVSWLRASERCLKFNRNSVKYGNTLCLFYQDILPNATQVNAPGSQTLESSCALFHVIPPTLRLIWRSLHLMVYSNHSWFGRFPAVML